MVECPTCGKPLETAQTKNQENGTAAIVKKKPNKDPDTKKWHKETDLSADRT